MPPDLGDMVGFLAGGILLYSGSPLLKAVLLSEARVSTEEKQSRALMAVGNLLWVLCGLLTEAAPIVIFCGVQALVQAAIYFKMEVGSHEEMS
jgi:hypothetical protein